MSRMAIAYPLARGSLDSEALTIRPRGPLRRLPAASITTSLSDIREASVRLDPFFSYLKIAPEGSGAITLMTRRRVGAALAERLRERGATVQEQKMFGRTSPT